jgi:hypothetical protein
MFHDAALEGEADKNVISVELVIIAYPLSRKSYIMIGQVHFPH